MCCIWWKPRQGVELTPYDPQFAAQMQALESVAREERDVLKKLAQQDE